AEDGIRDGHVTGVQTCALPILPAPEKAIPVESSWFIQIGAFAQEGNAQLSMKRLRDAGLHPRTDVLGAGTTKRYRVRCGPYSSRSEERRVGKECRYRWSQYHEQ